MTTRSREPFFSSGTLIVAAIAVVAVIAAWQVGKRSERRARDAATARPTPQVVPTAPPDPGESSAAFEVPLEGGALPPVDVPPTEPPPEPTPYPAFSTPEARPPDTTARCLSVEAAPTMSSAYGRSGEVVQLVVRARNGCGTDFSVARFRAIAVGLDGREAGSAWGRFPDGVRAWGSAETMVAIPTKPGTSLSYRVEPQ